MGLCCYGHSYDSLRRSYCHNNRRSLFRACWPEPGRRQGYRRRGRAGVGGDKQEADHQAVCRVHGIATPSSNSVINFEVWLPVAADWSGRLKVDGTGGYAGAIPVWAMVKDLAGGFAAAGSDMGHTGGKSVDWTIGHPEKVKDWGYRAHYVVTMAAKALTSAYYSRPAAHTYYEGCSNGGRQGMMMAERYPELFDGIIAGAPSMSYPDMVLSVLWTGYNLTPVRIRHKASRQPN